MTVITTNLLATETIKWIEQTDEVFHDHILPMLPKMPVDIQALLCDRLDDAADRHARSALGGDIWKAEAKMIKEDIEMYVHGWFKKIPRQWELRAGQLRREQDPEWAEFQRLKKKFEGSR